MESGALMMMRRTCEGAVKCSFLLFLLEEETLGLNLTILYLPPCTRRNERGGQSEKGTQGTAVSHGDLTKGRRKDKGE